jgi:DNA-directed RNA polymerase specialized sigma24 family protein
MTFEEFVANRLGALMRYAVVLAGDRGLAEDLVQDVLVRAYERWPRIVAADQPEAYVLRMVTNQYLSWRRRWSRMVPRADGRNSMIEPAAPAHRPAGPEVAPAR